MTVQILAVDRGGFPVQWLGYEDAARHYTIGNVIWTLGEPFKLLRGGENRILQAQSTLDLHPIIAVKGLENAHKKRRAVPLLTNKKLFARDEHLCLYCGNEFPIGLLTRDHVHPTSRGGQDVWDNVVTACKACNSKKDNRTPEEAHMPLLALPYTPNFAEALILANRHILADQMDFLKSFAGKKFR